MLGYGLTEREREALFATFPDSWHVAALAREVRDPCATECTATELQQRAALKATT
ncbi:hypothetical protein [Limobrevibacterium gyesilva]|uniref:hypothetical protein n=1 Tax=Limobrevibacterium gyesilva TaxID=2991712 RepID=UPI002227143B|nr:hypothetical protein [Limobrevibacterium gyesilva]